MKLKYIAFMLLVCCLFMGWQTCFAQKSASNEFFAMDTLMSVTAYGKKANDAVAAVEELVCDLEEKWSATRSTSEIYRLNAEKVGEASDVTRELICRAVSMSELTGGAFDPTIYPLVKAWGFADDNYRVPEVIELGSVDYNNVVISGNLIELKNNAEIDLGGIAKGYAGDMIADKLVDFGIESAIVSLGGNIVLVGEKPDGSLWRVGIQSPLDESGLIGIVSTANKSVITSGAYERYFIDEATGVKYGHIISPFTGYPVDNDVLSVTIISDEGSLGDALSTAMFVMGSEDALEFWRQHDSFEMILLTDTGTLYVTDGIFAEFKTVESDAVAEICRIKR